VAPGDLVAGDSRSRHRSALLDVVTEIGQAGVAAGHPDDGRHVRAGSRPSTPPIRISSHAAGHAGCR